MSSPVIPVPPPLNDSFNTPLNLSSICQHSYSSSQNTTHELQASSIPGRTSPDLSNTMSPPSTNNGSRNIYGCMVDVSKLHCHNDNSMTLCSFNINTSCVTQMTLNPCLYLHLLFQTLNHCLNPPYHHWIVDHLVET